MSRIGTLALMGAAHLCGSLRIRTTGSHVPHQSLNQGHATCTPDADWAVSRFRPDFSQKSLQPLVLTPSREFRRLIDGSLVLVSLIPTCQDLVLTFASTLTTTALDRCSSRWFGAIPCRPAPRGPPSSLMQHQTPPDVSVCSWHKHGLILRTHTSSGIPEGVFIDRSQ